MAFSIVTKEKQRAFEEERKGTPDKTPDICGYYGRACRQREKEEGANRALCMDCALADYLKKHEGEQKNDN